MNKIHNTAKDKFIAYNQYKSNRKKVPYVIFLHGLMSDMSGIKALHIENHCKNKDYNFIRFDNFGSGNSSGNFTDETIGSWLEGLELVLDQLITGEVVLIGSSMGAWVAMLAALKYPAIIKALIGIAPAIDFTEEAIWQKLPKTAQKKMMKEGQLDVSGSDCSDSYPISYQLIEEAREHLLLNQDVIDLKIAVHLIHGMQDKDVPYTISTRLLSKIKGENIVLKLIKDGGHRLSSPWDLDIITNSIDEVMNKFSGEPTT